MKFQIGDRIVVEKDDKHRGLITNHHDEHYQIKWDNSGTYWEFAESMDRSCTLEELYDSPLYKALT